MSLSLCVQDKKGEISNPSYVITVTKQENGTTSYWLTPRRETHIAHSSQRMDSTSAVYSFRDFCFRLVGDEEAANDLYFRCSITSWVAGCFTIDYRWPSLLFLYRAACVQVNERGRRKGKEAKCYPPVLSLQAVKKSADNAPLMRSIAYREPPPYAYCSVAPIVDHLM